jgi:SIR2-like domain
MKYEAGTVFVLGAGFTKAFLPKAPLLVDDFGNEELKLKFDKFSYTRRIFEQELSNPDHELGKINLERLMTRLSDPMPYDSGKVSEHELNLMLSELKQALVKRINDADHDLEKLPAELVAFASHVQAHVNHSITFNYDDLLEEAFQWFGPSTNGWNPNLGYGFPCKPAGHDTMMIFDDSAFRITMLFKLHGSLTWGIPLGTPKPCPANAICRVPSLRSGEKNAMIRVMLEPEPFIIPPILTKSAVVNQPIMKIVWSAALQALQNAKNVVFIGYSLPITDIGASVLFREGLAHLPQENVAIVDFTNIKNEEHVERKRKELMRAYKVVFNDLDESSIYLEGAAKWINHKLMNWLFNSQGKAIAFWLKGCGQPAFNMEGSCIGTIASYGEDPTLKLLCHGYRGEIVSRDRLLYRKADHSEQNNKGGHQYESLIPPIRSKDIEPFKMTDGWRDLNPDELQPRDRPA